MVAPVAILIVLHQILYRQQVQPQKTTTAAITTTTTTSTKTTTSISPSGSAVRVLNTLASDNERFIVDFDGEL